MERIINKVHIKSENVEIAYDELDDRGTRDIKVNWRHKPNKEFQDAMDALAEHVIDLSEFPDEWLPEIKVRSVSFSYEEENGTIGAVISATRELKHSTSPLNIHTPIKAESPGDVELAGDSKLFLSPQCVNALHVVRDRALDYLDGMHAGDNQEDMFAGGMKDAIADDSKEPKEILSGRKMKLSVSQETAEVFKMETKKKAKRGK